MLQSVHLVLCLALLAPNARSQGGGERPSLAGVWQAVRTFEVGAHGELVLRREGEDWRAEIGPFRSVPVDLSGGALSVRLPGDRGSFEGQPTERGTIEGHWTQRATRHAGMQAATPVTLLPGKGDTWRGNVEPLDDVFTCFLVVGPGETVDGVEAYPAFLRNPERNFGVFAEGERLERDGDEVRFIGRWRGRGEPYVLSMGTVSEAGDAVRLPFRGSTFDFERVEGDPASPFRARTPEPWTYVPPPARDDGWAVGTLAEVGMDEGPIRELVEDVIDAPVDSVHAPYVHAMLIARHGKLVVEESFHGFHRGVPHDTRSAAKSLTSFLVGATIQAGEAVALDDPVYETVGAPYLHGGLEARKRAITLEHLLTMSSGLDCDDRDPDSAGNEDTIQSQAENPDWYELILGLDLVRPPGTKAVYGSAQPHLVGRVLSAATGDSVEDLLHRHVARPLDFGRYHLYLQPTGAPYMGGGAFFLARDFLKLGQVVMDGGTWNGRRVLSEDFARRSREPLVRIGDRGYGYFWWSAELPYRDGTVQAFYAGGNGGQVVMGVPELDLVALFFAGNYSDPVMFRIQEELVPEFVLRAVE